MSDEQPVEEAISASDVELPEGVTALRLDSDIQIRNLAKREIDVRLAPFDTVINTVRGPEVIVRGAFADTDPKDVYLMGLEHEVHLGLGQDGSVRPVRRRAGRAISIEERQDGGYATFRVANLASGDEILGQIAEGLVDGVSVEMGGNARETIETRNGRRTHVVTFADLRAISPTYQPAYADARVLAVRSAEEDAPVATEEKAPDAGAPVTEERSEETRVSVQARSHDDDGLTLAQLSAMFQKPMDDIIDRLGKIEERGRSEFTVPAAPEPEKTITKGEWTNVVLRSLVGEKVPELQTRALQDVVTADNLGVVPEAFVNEMIGVIDPSRPFLSTTRRMPLPTAGMTINVPVITQRPVTGVQATQKSEIASQKTIITSTNFEAITIAGGADIAVQVLRRSSPSYLDLFLELLAEAYAIDAEDQAIDALLEAVNDGGPEPATALDPENLNLGDAFVTSFNETRRPPNTIWMSTKAVGEFIDAKASGTNAPLYPGLQASATAAGGIDGTISGLRPVHVPTLDTKGAYAIVGPSSGFAWTEDGTFTLQVDVPARAGRDVALVGLLWPMPWYPAAFSLYNVAS